MASSRSGTPRVQDARTKLGLFVETMRADKTLPVVLSEGDSWFSYPLNRNLMDFVEMMRDFAMLRLERSGEEARQILKPSGTQFKNLRKYLELYRFEALFFSGGGNDIVDENLPPLLNRKKPA